MMNKISYSTNWMGVANMNWYKDRGLTKRVTRTLTEDNQLTGRKAGDVLEYDEITQSYSCGRIDCNGGDLGPFGSEISVPPMKDEDWGRFGNWLWTFETDDMWSLKQLVELYEKDNPKISWYDEGDL